MGKLSSAVASFNSSNNSVSSGSVASSNTSSDVSSISNNSNSGNTLSNLVGHGVTVENSNGSKIAYGENNSGVGYSGSRVQVGEYDITDTNGNSYNALYNPITGEWDAIKTDTSGNQSSGSYKVDGTGNNQFNVYDPNGDGWTLLLGTDTGSNNGSNTGNNTNTDNGGYTYNSNTNNSGYNYNYDYDSNDVVGSGHKTDYSFGDAMVEGTDKSNNKYSGIKMGDGYYLITDSNGNSYTAERTSDNHWYVVKYDWLGRSYEGEFDTVSFGNGDFDVLDPNHDGFTPLGWL